MISHWSGPPRARSLRSFVMRVLVPRVAMFGCLAACIALGHVMAMDTSAHATGRGPAEAGMHRPTWHPQYAAEYPGCMPSYAWPAGQLASSLVVYSFRDQVRRRVPFAAAWRANHDATEVDDVWVIGVCG